MSARIIQAHYEQLENIAGRFGNQAEANAQLHSRVQRDVHALQQGGWEGEGAKAFFNEMEGGIFPAMQRLSGALEEAQSVTLKIKEIIQQAEEEASSVFQRQMDIATVLKPGSPGQSDVGGGTSPFNWWGTGGNIAGGLGNLIDTARNFRYKDYKSLGRVVNAIIGNKRGGWVGQMDDLGHLLKNPKIEKLGKALDGISLVAGIGEDLSKGYGWDKAIITEGVEFAVTTGGRKLLYAVPYVGQAMMVYDGAMLVGNLTAGGLEVVGLHDQAVWLQNTLDKVDVDQYIGDGLDWTYDRAAPVLKDVGQDITDFGVGFIDDAQDVVGDTIEAISGWF